MEIKQITAEMENALCEPLPNEAISQHPTKTYLSSIKAIYVTERLNTVFGTGVWTLKTEHITDGGKGMVVVKVILEIPLYGVYYESFGGNDNGGEASKNFDLGDAYKGATTDAITKICSYMGIGADVFKGKVNNADNDINPHTNKKKPLQLDDFKNFNKALNEGGEEVGKMWIEENKSIFMYPDFIQKKMSTLMTLYKKNMGTTNEEATKIFKEFTQ